MDSTSVSEKVGRLLAASPSAPDFAGALRAIAEGFGAVTATLHRADSGEKMLHLVTQLGLPEKLLPLTAHIPYGKGMAGLCVERAESITVCNLQTDASGVAKPGAKLTGVEGAISVPIFVPGGTEIAGTFGIGKPGEHTYTEDEQRVLDQCAHLFGEALARQSS
jgi:L-methionine (R)-S-oxide reductase